MLDSRYGECLGRENDSPASYNTKVNYTSTDMYNKHDYISLALAKRGGSTWVDMQRAY